MGILSSLKSNYDHWKAEADRRAEKALQRAQTKAEREKIRTQLRIETAQRKRAVAKAETEQKEAEYARKQANKKLNSGGFDFLGGLMNKPRRKSPTHRGTTKAGARRRR